MLLFAVLFLASSHLWPIEGQVTPALAGLFDALFLSVVTGTTLGYGSPLPVGTIARGIAMVECAFIPMVVLVLLAYVRGSGRSARELEVAD